MRRISTVIALLLLAGAMGCSWYSEKVQEAARPEGSYVPVEDRLTLHARILSRNALLPEWTETAGAPEVDHVLPLGDDGVLVGLVDLQPRHMNELFLSPTYDDLIAIEAVTGERRWSYERTGWFDGSQNVLLTRPVVLLGRVDEEEVVYAALDPDSGAPIWEWALPTEHELVIDDDAERAATISGDGESWGVVTLDLRSGDTLWERELAAENGQALPSLVALREQVLVCGPTLSALSWATGEETWALWGSGSEVSPTCGDWLGRILVARGEGDLSMIDESGDVVWSSEVSGFPEAWTSDEEYLVFALAGSEAADRIVALDRHTGERAWSRRVEGSLNSAMQIRDGDLVFTTDGSLEVRDVHTGAVSGSADLPFRTDIYRLPDHVVMEDDHVAVVSESSVAAFALPGAEALWSHEVQGGSYLSQAATRRERDSRTTAVSGDDTRALTAGHQRFDQSTDRAILQARQYREEVYWQTRSDYESGSAERRSSASFQRSLADTRLANAMAIDRTVSGMVTSVNMVTNFMAGVQAGQAIAQAWADEAAYYRAWAKVLLSAKLHSASVQDSLFVRPIRWERGRGLLLVDLRDGRWAEIPTSPSELYLEDEVFLDAPLATVVGDGSRLITLGIGLEPSEWESVERYTARTVRRSVLGYDLSDLVWNEPRLYDEESITNPR